MKSDTLKVSRVDGEPDILLAILGDDDEEVVEADSVAEDSNDVDELDY